MRKFRVFTSLLAALCVCLGLMVFSFNGVKASAEVGLKSGTYQNWIDRVQFFDNEKALDFYNWLIESTDGDGEKDYLIDVSTSYPKYVIAEISGSGNFTPDGNSANDEEQAKNAILSQVNYNYENYVGDAYAVYGAFNRDFPQVFWLSGEIYVTSGYSFSYYSSGEVTFNQEIAFLINGEGYDARASEYVTGGLNVREEIEKVENAVTQILNGVDEEASRYEKVKHFNKWLTENNCYATNITAESRKCRGALLGQDGVSPYAPVCEGYARAFKLLCDRAEIPCALTNGDAGEPHMWNLVQMENGSWYAVDVTWNDPVVSGKTVKKSGAENEDYLLVGKDTVIDGKKFGENRTVKNTVYEGGFAFTNEPALSASEYGAPELYKEWDVSAIFGEDEVTASLYKTEDYTLLKPAYKLIISGFGDMKGFSNELELPWFLERSYIKEIEIRSNITSVSDIAFKGFSSLERVTFLGNTTFENNTFANCKVGFVVRAHTSTPAYEKAKILGLDIFSLCEFGDWRVVENPTLSKSGKLEKVCADNSSHKEFFELPILNTEDYSFSVIKKVSCEEDGENKYVYSKDGQNFEFLVEVTKTGHDYGEPTYEWNYLAQKCLAKRVCNNDSSHVESEEGTVTTNVGKIDCTFSGEVTFTATFTNSAFLTQVKTEIMTAREHEYSEDWKIDEQSHWKECVCGDKKDFSEHTYGEWEIVKDATVFGSGLRKRSCVCGKTQEEVLPQIAFKDWISEIFKSIDKKIFILCGVTLVAIFALIIFIKILIKAKRKKK